MCAPSCMANSCRCVCKCAGHTSWSTSGLGYTTFWLLGKLRCFDGQAQPTRFIVAVIPLLGAATALNSKRTAGRDGEPSSPLLWSPASLLL